MRQFLLPLFIIVLCQHAFAQPDHWTPLLSPAELSALISRTDDVRLIQVTGDYEQGHIAGSVNAPYSLFRGPQDNPGQLPAPDQLQALIRSLGIERETPVVIIHQGSSASDMGAATRVYWTLKSASIEQLAILNGGLHGWREANLSISTQPVTVPASGYTLKWQDDWQITREQIAFSLNESSPNQPALDLVDARPADFYFGRQYSASRPGTIKGAENVSFDRWFDSNAMKPSNELRQLVQENDLNNRQQLVSFCNTGHWASINWFVMSEVAELPNTRLYAESVFDWSEQALPMDNQPGRLQHYWQMTLDWFSALRAQ